MGFKESYWVSGRSFIVGSLGPAWPLVKLPEL